MNFRICKRGHERDIKLDRCPICKKYARDSWKKNNAEKCLEYSREYYNRNKKKRKKYNIKYQKTRQTTDLLFKFKIRIRKTIYRSFNRKKLTKQNKASEVLCCSLKEAMNHLIQTAIKNYGKYDPTLSYHIDHIIPLKTATTEEEVIKLCHISNLQYLTPEDNITKGAKLEFALTN